MNYLDKDKYVEFYSNYGFKPLFVKTLFGVIVARFRKNILVISNSKIVRYFSRLLKVPAIRKKQAINDVENYLAFLDSLKVLRKKGVPVFFYNRVGLNKNGFTYSESALFRMNNNINFPKMSSDVSRYELDLRELFGNKYSPEYVKKISQIPQVIKKGNIYCHEDYTSELINVIEGKRVVSFANNSEHNIHVYGRCGVFGYAVSDSDTIPSQLQKLVNKERDDYRIVNHGLWGGDDQYILHNFFFDIPLIKEGDIVLFYMKHFDKKILPKYIDSGMYYKEITDEWHNYPESKWSFYDKPGHMNDIGYRHVAEIIYRDLKSHNFKVDLAEEAKNIDAKYLSNYLKFHSNTNFVNEVEKYVEGLFTNVPILSKKVAKTGSIVMNCNPFTFGHKYLIEYASKIVDRLIVFVVEENKSFFKYEDRFEMVKRGTKDLENVVVVPSGNFIISTITFPEYFLKDYVREKNFDLTQDLEIFCKMIAPSLGISVRFAGEEPFDPVTKNYNENMAKILPSNGIEFVEIPRKKVDGTEEVINATQVRNLIKQNNCVELRKYVPESTLDLIQKNYMRSHK